MSFSVALSGDSIINRRISVCEDPGFHEIVEHLEAADVAVTHLETLITDYDDPDVYPAAVPGEMGLRSPENVADELDWAGIDLVSHASNHALDYSYGALRSTWSAMDDVGIPLAGTGETLADARAPASLDTAHGRVSLVSMTSSFTRWSRAGSRRPDMGGRPGVNPLGWYHAVDADTLETVAGLAEQLGQWVIELEDGLWGIHPPGLHNTLSRFREADVDRPTLVLDERDREGNLRAIEDAARRSDLVIAQLHSHEWTPGEGLTATPEAIEAFARDCVERGADIVLNQGTHAPLRGIEMYEDGAIFYDPGDLIMMLDSIDRQPPAYYERFAPDLEMAPWEATVSDVYEARPAAYHNATNPPGGYESGSVRGFVVPVCEFSEEFALESIALHPGGFLEEPKGYAGIPTTADDALADEILTFLAEASEPYGTEVRRDGAIGRIEIA